MLLWINARKNIKWIKLYAFNLWSSQCINIYFLSRYEKLAEHTESKRVPLISHESYNKLYHLSTIKQPP